MVPGFTERMITKYGDGIIFNPEFLTEANAYNDFVNQDRIILGGHGETLKKSGHFFEAFFQNSKIILCTPKKQS